VQFLSGNWPQIVRRGRGLSEWPCENANATVGSGDVDHKCDSRDSRVARSPHRWKERRCKVRKGRTELRVRKSICKINQQLFDHRLHLGEGYSSAQIVTGALDSIPCLLITEGQAEQFSDFETRFGWERRKLVAKIAAPPDAGVPYGWRVRQW